MALEQVYRLKVTLKSITPAIWRRVEVPASATLGDLHDVIQAAMGWENAHLHEFVFGKPGKGWPTHERRYSDPDMELEEAEDERNVTLAEAAPAVKTKFLYVYDFGDDWRHEVLVERIEEAQPGVEYPRCTGGARRAPVEDSGGPRGWMDKVALINEPAAGGEEPSRREELREWMGLKPGERVDTEAFDLEEVNADMRDLFSEGGEETAAAEAEPEEDSAEEAPRVLRLVSYEIVSTPMHDDDERITGPADLQKFLLEAYGALRKKPAKIIPELEKWLEKYPTAARLMNYLGVAYALAGRKADARAMAERAYRANPDYLFARLNYAEFFLRDRQYDKVKEIMEDKWDISLLYPGRKRFHISEVLGFIGLVGRYMVGIGKLDLAETYADMAMQLDPESDAAEVLEEALATAAMKEGMNRMIDTVAARRRVKKRQRKDKKGGKKKS
ncbi:MAG TPA: hypothetical protein VH253_01540 [Phycisphaerae bacterium]|nr:hypothetical protein [Phycisphaerae bacterium]